MCKKLLIFSLAFCVGLIFWETIEKHKINSIQKDKTTNSQFLNKSEIKLQESGNFDSTQTVFVQNAVKDNVRFGVAGADNDREIKDLYLKFQNAIAEDDKKTVASLMTYPLRVTFSTDKPDRHYTLIKNKKTFLRVYDRIFDNRLRKFIAQIDVENNKDIWARYDGISVGRGVIWIGVFCYKRYCEDGKHYINIRTIHGDSNLINK